MEILAKIYLLFFFPFLSLQENKEVKLTRQFRNQMTHKKRDDINKYYKKVLCDKHESENQ